MTIAEIKYFKFFLEQLVKTSLQMKGKFFFKFLFKGFFKYKLGYQRSIENFRKVELCQHRFLTAVLRCSFDVVG